MSSPPVAPVQAAPPLPQDAPRHEAKLRQLELLVMRRLDGRGQGRARHDAAAETAMSSPS